MATSEAAPFAKTGGLADVLGSLPSALKSQGADVRVIMPKYGTIPSKLRDSIQHNCYIFVKVGWRNLYCGIEQAEYNGVIYYFIDNEFYFNRDGFYGYNDDGERFAFFCRAVMEAIPHLDFKPDIIHCHDWQTGMLPVYLKTLYKYRAFYHNMHVVYTIHNMMFQGRWKLKAVRDITGLPTDLFTPDKLESYGEANCLKGGVVYADVITTVSKAYAQEITTPVGGEGLDGLMNAHKDKLYGIINGIDYEIYNSQTDANIYYLFGDKDFIEGKKKNKQAFQKALGLDVDEKAMLIGIVSRLNEQKGFALVEYMIDQLLSDGRIQFAVLGTGEERYENMFRYFAKKYPKRLSINIERSDELAHKIYASCDAFLMPSQFEPCGLSQLMSLRYGTVPIVRETGGLKDTVIAYNEAEHTGTGFFFMNYNAHEMKDAILRALNVFRNHRDDWNEIAIRAMNQDYSWKNSAQEYGKIYDMICANNSDQS
jgi:starch synthase